MVRKSERHEWHNKSRWIGCEDCGCLFNVVFIADFENLKMFSWFSKQHAFYKNFFRNLKQNIQEILHILVSLRMKITVLMFSAKQKRKMKNKIFSDKSSTNKA